MGVRVTVSAPADVRSVDVRPVDVRYGQWDHAACVWFCLCRPTETTLRTGQWDQQRSRCQARRCEAQVRTGNGTMPLVCGFAFGGQQKRHFGPGNGTSSGSLERVEVFQIRIVASRFTSVCRSCCGAAWAGRGLDGTGVHKGLDPSAVCVVLLMQANGSDTPGLALAPSPSRPLGAGRRGGELHTHHPPPPHPTPLTLIGPEDRRVGQSEGG